MHGTDSRKLLNFCKAVYAKSGKDGPIQHKEHIDNFPRNILDRIIRKLKCKY